MQRRAAMRPGLPCASRPVVAQRGSTLTLGRHPSRGRTAGSAVPSAKPDGEWPGGARCALVRVAIGQGLGWGRWGRGYLVPNPRELCPGWGFKQGQGFVHVSGPRWRLRSGGKAAVSWLNPNGLAVRNGWQKLNDADLEPIGFSGTVEQIERRGAKVSVKVQQPKRPNYAVKGTCCPQARRGARADSAPRRACGHHAPYL